MVAKITKHRRVRQAAKYEQDKLAVKRRRVRLAAKYEQAKLTAKLIIQSFKKCGISNSLNELEDIKNNDVDEIIEKRDEKLVIEVHENLVDTARLQA
ncbi:7718_t:CDS:2, partial [Rhizophagus irregularis]